MSIALKDHSQAQREAPRRTGAGNAVLLVLFLCAAFAFLLRSVVSPQILNMVVTYTAEGGSFPEKLHFGTYAVFFVLALALTVRPILLRGDEIRLFRATLGYSLFIVALVPYLFLAGRAGSAGFIIDSYLVACAAAAIMIVLGSEARRALGEVMLGMIILSAVIGIAEAVTQQRLMPYTLRELEFRPIGLSAHPLALGALAATAIGFVVLTRWPIWVRALCIFLLFAGTAASGARAALLLAAAEIVLLLMLVPLPGLSPRHQRQAKLVLMLLVLAGGAVLLAVLFSGGLLNRFGNTIFDENFFARVTIYQVFGLVGWKDILFGMDGNALLAIVNQRLGLPYIESAPVVIGLLFGVPIALAFAVLFFRFFFQLLRNAPRPAWIGASIFLLTALSNNALSSKAPDILIVTVLVLAFQNTGQNTGVRKG